MAAEERPKTEGFKPDLSQVISAFGMQALLACGKIMNPLSRKFETDLLMAQYHIGVLEVLESKTAGNLTNEEKQLLENLLHQSRVAYIDASRGVGKVETE